ncbi:MAG: hypothetical protein IIV80_03825 [Clostridia bacterium]|nr:hypothetical protein [Clostridia bacterium]
MHERTRCDETPMLRLSLQFFAEGGAGDGGGSGGGDSGAASASPAGESGAGSATNESGGKTYTQEDRDAVAKQFGLIPHDAVKSRYKAKFDKAGKYDQMASHLGAVAERYGVSLDDPEGLAKAILNDGDKVRAKAVQMGVSEDVARGIVSTETENAITRAKEAARVRREEFSRMAQEEAAVKETYPDFDFDAEAENKAFKKLVDGGYSMKDAYEITHRAELTEKAIAAAVEQAKAAALEEYRANAARPAEGASGSTPGTDVPTNYKGMTDAELKKAEKKFL